MIGARRIAVLFLVCMVAKGLCAEYKVMHKAEDKQLKYAGAKVEEVQLIATGGVSGKGTCKRKGILWRKPDAPATVIIAHGFSCSKDDVRFLRYIFERYNVLVFDFRAHGENTERQCCTFGSDEAYDVKAAVDFIRSDPQMKKLPIISYAFSMGAVASIEAQARFGKLFDCAIWDCPFDSTEELLVRMIGNLKVTMFGHVFAVPGHSFLMKYAYNPYVQSILKMALKTVANIDASQVPTRVVPIDTVASAQKVTIPVFLITCRNDAKAPPSAVRKVYEAAMGYKRYWVTDGRHHFDSFFYNPEKYTYKVRRFIEKFLSESYKTGVQQKIYQDVEKIGSRAAHVAPAV
ncbi:TPA: hypothetical protein DDZ86_03865 [Candidatus Dependentiae bacterium]|nr:MAG: Family S9 peptidase [candidate division TM6 bacterium GW2011_GWF2_43_87]HBL98753.1 hypothetical protein [Candidatus Dependentiae bacterium]